MNKNKLTDVKGQTRILVYNNIIPLPLYVAGF